MLKVACCGVLIAGCSIAQNCTVEITVLGRNGTPELGVPVVIEHLRFKSERPRRTATDRRGKSFYLNLSTGPNRITAVGAEPVDFECGKPYRFEFTLQAGGAKASAPVSPSPLMAGPLTIAAPKPRELPRQITNSVGITFVLIPAGTFVMGKENSCPKDSPFTHADEYKDCLTALGLQTLDTPAHRVTISKPFYMSETEITQEQYVAIYGVNHSRIRGENVPGGDSRKYPIDRPVLNFINTLNELEKTNSYRLPTEAEWMYAATAGGKFHPDVAYLIANERVAENSKIPAKDRYGKLTETLMARPAGTGKPNPWGLYDMWGNLSEVIADLYLREFKAVEVTDPIGDAYTTTRIHSPTGQRHSFSPSYDMPAEMITKTVRPLGSDSLFGVRLVKEID